MGFFAKKVSSTNKGISVDMLHRLECRACPLNQLTENQHPHMKPTGTNKPLVYILGEAPNEREDAENDHFIGPMGEMLRARIPKWLKKDIRWNNVVRTRPRKNATPGYVEIEACRPSVERDIAATKPKVIWGFGNIPLAWVSGQSGITDWRGRRFPVTIGGHTCWYYAFAHPRFLLGRRSDWARKQGPMVIGSEDERVFAFNIKQAVEDLEHLPTPVVHTKEMAERNLHLFAGGPGQLEQVIKLLSWASKQEYIGYDYETKKGIDNHGKTHRPYAKGSAILMVGIGNADKAFSFALDHKQNGWTKDERKILDKHLKKFLASKVHKVVHSLPYELEWTGEKLGRKYLRAWNGDKLDKKTIGWECTLTQAATIDERKSEMKRQRGPLSLGFLTRQYFGVDVKTLNPIDRANIDDEPIENALKYNAIDARYHCNLYEMQRDRLKELGLTKPYKIGLRRIPTLILTQMKGPLVDQALTHTLERKYEKENAIATKALMDLKCVSQFKKRFKKDFNPGSASGPDSDVVVMFKDILHKEKEILVYDKKKKEEKFTTNEDVISLIDHPLAQKLIDWRKIQKKSSTYLYKDLWPGGVLHTIYNPGFTTDTSRLSSEAPNLQNIPKREEGTKEVRAQIMARPGHVLVPIDYGQIEARVIAMASRDKRFVKYLWDRHDVHMDWAKRIAADYPRRIGGKQNLEDLKAMKLFRTDIKNQWTFPLFFGAALDSVAGYLKIPTDKVEPAFDDFQEEFKGVFEWQKTLIEFYKTNGYVANLLGRRRRAPLSPNKLINAPIQSTACEIVMDGMNRLSEMAMETGDWYFQPLLNIHDDLTFELPADKLDYYLPIIVNEMLSVPFDFVNVPITVEVSVGTNLLNTEEVFTTSSDEPGVYRWNENYFKEAA